MEAKCPVNAKAATPGVSCVYLFRVFRYTTPLFLQKETPLQLACEKISEYVTQDLTEGKTKNDTVAVLVELKADANTVSEFVCIVFMIQSGCCKTRAWEQGNTPLRALVTLNFGVHPRGYLQQIRDAMYALLKYGHADVTAKDKKVYGLFDRE